MNHRDSLLWRQLGLVELFLLAILIRLSPVDYTSV